MSQFDFGALGGLLSGVQERMEEMKRRTAETEVTGEAGDGLVKVRISCDYDVKAVSIADDAVQDRELLEDLVRAAVGEALRKAKEEQVKNIEELTGGLPLPPGLFPGFS